MKDKKALIFGITGQDGILLSNLLIKKKYKVYGFYRDKKKIKLVNKKVLKIYKKDLNNEIISKFIKHKKFDEIYFLIGQSESHSSFKFPEKSLHSNFIIFTHIINNCIRYSKKTKVFYASSGEIFGNSIKNVNEESQKNPLSPYALSKYLSMEYIRYFRKFYNLNISVGIFFNHDSVYRSKDNFSKKLINYLKGKNFKKFKLELGNIDIHRDFGYAKEYVDAIYKINKSRDADDYIIATGKSTLVRNVIKFAFKLKNKNYLKFIKINKNKFKNKHVKNMSANINKIKKKIKWVPKKNIKDLIREEII
jgi:GDPmannose 4,6-dehydratase